MLVNGREYTVDREGKYYVVLTTPPIAGEAALADLDTLLELGYELSGVIHRVVPRPALLIFRKTKVEPPS
jgi:hypothetical protein